MSAQVGVSLMVCIFSSGWSVAAITYDLSSLKDLPEIALVKTAHMAPENLGFISPRCWQKKTAVFGFGNRHSTNILNN